MTKLSLHTGMDHVDSSVYAGWSGLLKNPRSDVTGMAAFLTLCGFTTRVLYDEQCNLNDVRKWIQASADTLVSGDTFIYHDSGHGSSNGTTQGIVYYDGEMSDAEFHNLIALFKPGVNVILIMDCCYASGDLDRALFRIPRGMHKLVADKLASRPTNDLLSPIESNVVELAACRETETASDGNKNYGMWTGALLESGQNMLDSGNPPTIEQWFEAGTRRVYGQTPQLLKRGANPDLVATSFLSD